MGMCGRHVFEDGGSLTHPRQFHDWRADSQGEMPVDAEK
jgi:hypothetical protein